MHKPSVGRRRLAPLMSVLAVSLALGSVALAADPPPPQDEWWKRAKPPKRHAPMTWSVGGYFGIQDWVGLEDYSPSAAEYSAGWRGDFDTTSPIYGVVGSIELKRFGTIGVDLDMFLDAFSNSTSTPGVVPLTGGPVNPTNYDVDLGVWRVGVAGRSIFRSASRVQPTASLGLALAIVSVDSVGVDPTGTIPPYDTGAAEPGPQIDLMASGGVDIAVQKNVRQGWRIRLEAGVEYRSFDQWLAGFDGNTAGPLAYKATIGFIYRHEPPAPKPTPAEQ